MTIFLLIVGVLLIVSGINNTSAELFGLVKSEFGGTDTAGNKKDTGFLPWAFAIWGLGALGYIPGMRPVSNALLVLVAVVILLHAQKGGTGFFKRVSMDVTAAPGQNANDLLGIVENSGAAGDGGLFGLISNPLGLFGTVTGLGNDIQKYGTEFNQAAGQFNKFAAQFSNTSGGQSAGASSGFNAQSFEV